MSDPLKRTQTNDNLAKLLLVTEEFRKMDREVPAQVISMFFYIASHDPCHKQALEEDLDYTVASASRNLDWLSDRHRLSKPGLGLVEKFRDPENGRRFMARLTPKGYKLASKLEAIIYD